ncbi:hypothetical protein CT0861_07881, partial [Colletotrichum tofieldiae]
MFKPSMLGNFERTSDFLSIRQPDPSKPIALQRLQSWPGSYVVRTRYEPQLETLGYERTNAAMAEVFGVVVSALTVAEMAGKFGTSLIKLKKLWNEVQDVPNEIAQLFRQLELLRPVLAEMESEFTQQTHKVYQNSAANLSMEYCQQAVGELDALAEDLQSRINAAKRSKRNIAKFKVAFKKEQIRSYQEKIQFALQLLCLSQQTYTISVVKSRLLAIPASFFGGFVYQTVSDPSHPNIEVHQARVQLPWWISETVWDFQAHRAYTGWKISLKLWIRRPNDAPIFIYVEKGSLHAVMKAFNSNEASLQDVDEIGWSLLHHAIFWGHLDVSKTLVDMGLSLNDVGMAKSTPLNTMDPCGRALETFPDLFGYLLDTGELDDHVESYFLPEDEYSPSSSLPEVIWKVPKAIDMVIKKGLTGLGSYYQFPPEKRFSRLEWRNVNPKVLLDDIYKGGNLEPADFRVVFGISYDSSLISFAVVYFRDLFWTAYGNIGRSRSMNHWRELARWSFGGLSVEELCQKERGEFDPVSMTPMFAGLVGVESKSLFLAHYQIPRLRNIQRALVFWLEDVQSSGIDLAEY